MTCLERFIFISLASVAMMTAQTDADIKPAATPAAAAPVASSLLDVKRIYVGTLTGLRADSLRELIIASLNGSKLFTLTDNPERADATLKGAADDQSYTDTFDSDSSVIAHTSYGSKGSRSAISGGSTYPAISMADNESAHSKERKHEAYAAVRLCNRDGDVIWSTTQESPGGKFHGASADVAGKVARQLAIDVDKARRSATNVDPPAPR